MNFTYFQIALGLCIAMMRMVKSFPQNDDLMAKYIEINKQKLQTWQGLDDGKKFLLFQTLENDYKQLQEKFANVQEKFVAETNFRRKLQAIIDLNQIVKFLFDECYPKWGEYRNAEDFSKQAWYTMFLNVEHPRIFAMKMKMEKSGISEEQFIKHVNHFIVIQNDHAHRPLTNTEREKSYPQLLAASSDSHKVVLAVLLQFSYTVNEKNEVMTKEGTVLGPNAQRTTISTTSPPQIENTAQKISQKVKDKTKRARKGLNLLVLSNFIGEAPSEHSLKTELDATQGICLQACLVHEKRAFLLFEDFEMALAAWHYFKEQIERFTKEKPPGVIRNSLEFIIHKNAKTGMKITLPSALTAGTSTISRIKDLVHKERNITNFEKPTLWQQDHVKTKNIFFVTFKTLQHLLITYHEMKKELKSTGIDVSIISEASTHTMMVTRILSRR